ncbi:MAG: phosphoribosylanthranilate isomerase [Acidiferrobacteraceae bacterium]
MRTRVKICGITRPEDALTAVSAGTDAIGLVFAKHSARRVTVEQAEAVIRVVPPFVTVVGLFADAADDEIREVLKRLRIDLLQFHGQETPEDCRRYGAPYIKAVAMGNGADVGMAERLYSDSLALLLDSHVPGAAGGTGRVFDWEHARGRGRKPVILAGGLTPENVGEAIRRVCPFAVDVSGGVERARGVKDEARMRAFVREVRRADEESGQD